MKYVSNGFAPFLSANDITRKIRDVYEGTVFESLDVTKEKAGIEYYYVKDKSGVMGWIYKGWLDVYEENLSKDIVNPNGKTPDPNDAEQFLIRFGVRQVNLCGQLCVANLLNISIDELLEKWQKEAPSFFERVFNWRGGKVAWGTGIADLQSMFSAFGVSTVSLNTHFKDANIRSRVGSPIYTPSKLNDVYRRGIIASVHMNKLNGVLNGGGVLHWVVVKNVFLERYGMGSVEIYNPYMDRNEIYSWREFVASARAPYGVAMSEIGFTR